MWKLFKFCSPLFWNIKLNVRYSTILKISASKLIMLASLSLILFDNYFIYWQSLLFQSTTEMLWILSLFCGDWDGRIPLARNVFFTVISRHEAKCENITRAFYCPNVFIICKPQTLWIENSRAEAKVVLWFLIRNRYDMMLEAWM